MSDDLKRENLAKHYSPIIYQHVDTVGDDSAGGKSDLILPFNYDGQAVELDEIVMYVFVFLNAQS